MWSPIIFLVEVLTYLVLALLLWKGRTPERIVALALIVLQWGSPLIDHLFIGQFRWAVASLSFGMFCLLVTLSLRYDRWWLLLAAGAQLIALSTHFAAVAGSGALLWSIVSTRMVIWFELLLLSSFGVWEARNAPYARSQSKLQAKPGGVISQRI